MPVGDVMHAGKDSDRFRLSPVLFIPLPVAAAEFSCLLRLWTSVIPNHLDPKNKVVDSTWTLEWKISTLSPASEHLVAS